MILSPVDRHVYLIKLFKEDFNENYSIQRVENNIGMSKQYIVY